MELTTILTWILIGGIAGLLAEWLVGGVGVGGIGTVLLGIAGAFVGAWLFRLLGVSVSSGLLNDIVTAFVGAAVLLVVLRVLRRA